MNSRIAALILGTMTAIGSASPVELAAEARSVPNPRDSAASNSTAPGEFHSLVTRAGARTSRAPRRAAYLADTLFNGFADTISSIGPDQGTTCTLYVDAGCSGASLGGIVNPGINNLADYNFNDRASSYRCY